MEKAELFNSGTLPLVVSVNSSFAPAEQTRICNDVGLFWDVPGSVRLCMLVVVLPVGQQVAGGA